ncbi:hypothetical protein EDB89DRAFT_1915673 [Lactarius sanguifluus]|nr:hypothetical protein EDB89DRAFT_1915673 [Lactarius sanguifluus]
MSARDEKAITKQQNLGLEWLGAQGVRTPRGVALETVVAVAVLRGVATGVEVAVAVMGTTGTRTRGGWGDSDVSSRLKKRKKKKTYLRVCHYCVFTQSRRPRGHRQGLVAAATAVAVMGVTCTCTRGGGGNGDVSSKLESKKNLSRNVCGGGYWAGSWRAPRGGVEAIVAATGLGRRGRCRGGSDEGWWHRRRDMTLYA